MSFYINGLVSGNGSSEFVSMLRGVDETLLRHETLKEAIDAIPEVVATLAWVLEDQDSLYSRIDGLYVDSGNIRVYTFDPDSGRGEKRQIELYPMIDPSADDGFIEVSED